MKTIKRKIKRQIATYLFPEKVKARLQLREGVCKQCGKCCKLLFRCPMLIGRKPPYTCRIYAYRSTVCKQFPFCAGDLDDVNNQCGFSFRKQAHQ